MRRAVTVIGVGDDGCLGIPARAMNAIARAEVLVGGERLLAFFADAVPGAERIAIKGGLAAVLDRVAALADERNVVVVASGDPLFYGIGVQVVQRLGAEHVEIIPQVSSVQWAFARVGQPWHDATLLSLHARGRRGLAVRLRRASRAAILTDDENSPPRLAAHLLEHGVGDFTAWVCENLAGPGERVRSFTLAELAEVRDVAPLNVLLLARTDPAWRPPPALPYLPEDAFARRIPKKGLITKREVRALSLGALQLRPDSVIWDIGAGSGSVGIEAGLLCPEGRVCAVEIDEECVAMARENVRAHGADNVDVVHGLAPAALADLPTPDAVFVGGSKGAMDEVIDVALSRLKVGGRLVVNAITLDNVAEAYRAFRSRDLVPELVVASCSRGEPLARYLRYEAQNPVHIFSVTKPAPPVEPS